MDYQIITFSKEDFPDQSVWDIGDEQLEKHLSQTEKGIAIILLLEMAAGADLLNWLSKWQLKCEESNKGFFIIAENTDQQECIEFSHPDLNLVYFSSKEELFDTNPEFSQNTETKNNYETSSNPVFDFNYNSIPPNVENKISYPDVIKDDSENNDKNDKMKTEQESNEEIGHIKNRNDEIEKKLDLHFTESIKKNIDVLIEEKLRNYFEKKNVSENLCYDYNNISGLEEDKKKSVEGDDFDNLQNNREREKSNYSDTGEDKNRAQNLKSLMETDIVESKKNIIPTSLFKENRTVIDAGSIIEVAGEYECCKCNVKRMYIKGDIAVKCENQECLSSLSGWRLSFDLF